MVAGLLVLLLAGSLQIGFALHVRNTVQDAASAGARFGTLRDRSPEDGVRRTSEIIRENLPGDYADHVSYRVGSASSDADQLEIVVSTRLPVLLAWGPDHGIEVSGHAVVPTT